MSGSFGKPNTLEEEWQIMTSNNSTTEDTKARNAAAMSRAAGAATNLGGTSATSSTLGGTTATSSTAGLAGTAATSSTAAGAAGMAGLSSAGAYEFGSELGAGAGAGGANVAGHVADTKQRNAQAMQNAASTGAGGMGTSK